MNSLEMGAREVFLRVTRPDMDEEKLTRLMSSDDEGVCGNQLISIKGQMMLPSDARSLPPCL